MSKKKEERQLQIRQILEEKEKIKVAELAKLLSVTPETLRKDLDELQERKILVRLLKKFEVTIKGFRPVEEAIITSGGINTKEINPKTMESKLIKGLYFAGEIIDVDAYTGGFNLQIAYSTGYTAGITEALDKNFY